MERFEDYAEIIERIGSCSNILKGTYVAQLRSAASAIRAGTTILGDRTDTANGTVYSAAEIHRIQEEQKQLKAESIRLHEQLNKLAATHRQERTEEDKSLDDRLKALSNELREYLRAEIG